MDGAITLFTTVAPDVQRIETSAGGKRDTAYVLTASG